jgi:uncharacterized protein
MADKPENAPTTGRPCIAFAGSRCIARGDLLGVVLEAKKVMDGDDSASVLLFDAVSSDPVDVDLRGSSAEVVARLVAGSATQAVAVPGPAGQGRTPGRPKLGVVAREVTLLPRHWEWLNEQPGGASVTLRKLVESARRSTAGEVEIRRAREACYRFMHLMAGDEPGYEEALRALFSGDREPFEAHTDMWPADVKDHARRLADASFASPQSDD